jgi:hypothetical protein
MPWQPLPDDVPLDHEALTPPPHMDEPTGKFAPLPDDAPLDQSDDATLVDRPKADDAPIIISRVKEVNPTYNQAGFVSGGLQPDAQYHTSLSEGDKKEYADFFKDPKNPPDVEHLRQWFHEKTGAYMSNADAIVKHFKDRGEYSTQQQFIVPKPKRTANEAYRSHFANAATLDFGPEVGGFFSALTPGGATGDDPSVWDGTSFTNAFANNADLIRARMDAETEQHPVASAMGELSGVVATAPVLGAAGDAAGLAKLAAREGEFNRTLIQGSGEGFAYGSGAGGPGHRLEGGATGAAMVPAVAGVAKIPVAAANMGKTVLEGSPGLARRIIAKAIKDDAHTPESIGHRSPNPRRTMFPPRSGIRAKTSVASWPHHPALRVLGALSFGMRWKPAKRPLLTV